MLSQNDENNSQMQIARQLDAKKISFISCVNNEKQYAVCKKAIEELKVPEGIKVEVIAIRNAGSMAEGYETARLVSDAKYKVYLHQDLIILNEDFIANLLKIFHYKDVGVVGLIGCQKLSTSGIWWRSPFCVGCVGELLKGKSFLNFHKPSFCENELTLLFYPATAVDGVLLATQYDVPWRRDIFDGWHFYDISCCLEYQRKGYAVAIARQDVSQPWAIHCHSEKSDIDYADMQLWAHYRRCLVFEYQQELGFNSYLEEKSITIILFTADEKKSEEKINQLKKLKAPKNYNVEVFSLGISWRTHKVTEVQFYCKSKYKIFMDDRAEIINENIMSDIIKIFSSDKRIAVVGTAGLAFSENPLSEADYWQEKNRLGSVKIGGKDFFWQNIKFDMKKRKEYKIQLCDEVMAIDDYFFATQYDIAWDVVRYGDTLLSTLAAVFDARRRGYIIVVARQEKPWIALDKMPKEKMYAPLSEEFEKNWGYHDIFDSPREFIAEYEKDWQGEN